MTKYLYNLGLAFYSIADNNKSAIALSYPDGTIHTYVSVNEYSNQLARFLLINNIGKGNVIAIFNDKSHHAYCLMLACLKIGVIYTNLDNTNPAERLKKIITRCKPKAIFYDEPSEVTKEIVSGEDLKTFHYHTSVFSENVSKLSKANLSETVQVHGGDPAYIMFTSGSTGFPKGAAMSHNNVLNFISWGQQTFNITSQDVFTNVNPIYFDNSVFDFYTSVFSGATLVPLDSAIVKSPQQLVAAINKTRCTIWFSVPSLLVYLLTTKALTKEDFPSIKRISFGGEGFPKNKLKQLFQLFGNRITLFNVYGPTECTCICSSYIISEVDFENMNELAPLGYIAPNFGYEILPLDESDRNYGELALTGPCVGLGYFNDEERTLKSFVQNPHKDYQERMYKTGDLVQKAENGYLYFKGRVDNQIKHMGYRVELEEVEAAFSSLEYVNEVGVIYEKITTELGQIKAFVSITQADRDAKQIQADLKKILPAYMIPKVIIIDALPKNRNGKIDRKQLIDMQ